jgi:hypothetical protein
MGSGEPGWRQTRRKKGPSCTWQDGPIESEMVDQRAAARATTAALRAAMAAL